MIQAAASGVVARDGTRGRRRGSEGTETVEHARRGNSLGGPPACVFGDRTVAVGGHGCARERHETPKHFDERARQRQIRPAAVGRHMEKHDQSLAAALGGHQRRTVRQRCPGPVVELRVRFGQHLAGDGDVGWNRHPIEWALAREAGELLWFVPTQAAAQDPAATPQFHRHQIVIATSEVRPSKANENPAIVDPLVQAIERIVDIADIREDEHRQIPIQKSRHGFRRCNAFGQTDVRKWIERAGKIIGRADQRLRAIGSRTGHNTNRTAAPTLVEQLYDACRTLAGDFQSCHVVADFDRQIDHSVGLPLAGFETERCFAQRQTFEVDRTHRADIAGGGLGAQHFHRQRAGRVVGSGEGVRCGQASFDDGQRTAADDSLQALNEIGAFAKIDTIRKPDNFDIGGSFKETFDCRQRIRAVDAVRLGFDLLDLDARGAGNLQGNVAVGFGQRQHRNAAIVCLGARDHLVSRPQPGVPGRCRGPAVIDQDQQRRRPIRGRKRRIPHGSSGGDDYEGCKRQPEEREPPWGARRSFLLGGDLKQQAGRRKINASRARWHEPQQPPEDRQAKEAEKHQRLGEAKRQRADHAALAGLAGACRLLRMAVCALSPIRECSTSRSSLAGLSVRWIVKLHPRKLVSARMSARWRATMF